MPCLHRRAMPALLAVLFAHAAVAADGLPGIGDVEVALERAAALEPAPENAEILALLASTRVDGIRGCAPMEAQLGCVVSMSRDRMPSRHHVLAFARQQGEWVLRPGNDTRQAPVPTLDQARDAGRAYAREVAAEDGGQHPRLARVAEGFDVQRIGPCRLDTGDGSIACESHLRELPEHAFVASELHFLLDGGQWRVKPLR
ncbi:hypothetical protein OK348_08195 [Flavobacterium sp. MXW15]|uniref:Uncharacterized protein n=1 Tax=Xanthomonas chitinilytica TaxID=2989819 RepID=A0ABT3JVU8_9XANT|nr:hypothetical protein [Xanthomonas sp. H13-6]MCW4454775.1 hypothetical protein [Flavobacterium sp. MXW15]MCW4472597.1 hypothetical protein [Xanthomonas sp. H13-6]